MNRIPGMKLLFIHVLVHKSGGTINDSPIKATCLACLFILKAFSARANKRKILLESGDR